MHGMHARGYHRGPHEAGAVDVAGWPEETGEAPGPTQWTGTCMPRAQWPGMWQPTTHGRPVVADPAGTVQLRSTRSPDLTTTRIPLTPGGTLTTGVGPGGRPAVAASAASHASWTAASP